MPYYVAWDTSMRLCFLIIPCIVAWVLNTGPQLGFKDLESSAGFTLRAPKQRRLCNVDRPYQTMRAVAVIR